MSKAIQPKLTRELVSAVKAVVIFKISINTMIYNIYLKEKSWR